MRPPHYRYSRTGHVRRPKDVGQRRDLLTLVAGTTIVLGLAWVLVALL